ncbi:MAG: heme o synthase [Paracoccaceae bacterium]|nr:heme o synthase [Paracoccaceae bacterium]
MVDLQANLNEDLEPQVSDYFELLKPKVMRLVVFTAAIGLLAAPSSVHPVIALASLLCVAVGAGAAGALNMWWDSDIDLIMKRTSGRPIPSGRINSDQALVFGTILAILSIILLGLFANFFAAALLAFTIFFYLVIYSMWLKRVTPQNIVIGGAAGAFPPMIGWSIATGGVGLESILMFLLIFMWTPPHFWTLALFMNQDYSKARVPMLTVTHGMITTRKNIIAYTIILAVLALIIAFSELGGPLYFLVCVPLNIGFLIGSFKIFKRNESLSKLDNFRVEKKVFVFSIFYLFAHFGIIGIETVFKVLIPNYFFWPQIF